MDDDDDFGDLYSDVLEPLTSSHTSIFSSSSSTANPPSNPDLNLQSNNHHDYNLYNNKPSSSIPLNFTTPPSTISNQTPLAPKLEIPENGLFVAASTPNSIEGHMVIEVKKEKVDEGVRVLEETPNGGLLVGSVRVSELRIGDTQVDGIDHSEGFVDKVRIFSNENVEEKTGVDDLGSEPIILDFLPLVVVVLLFLGFLMSRKMQKVMKIT